MRKDRKNSELRKVSITPHVLNFAEGSALVEFGNTKVMCAASYEPQAPKWLQGSGTGWITAEYGMLPRSTHQRIKRDKATTSGRSLEISRLIGRSLRAAVDTRLLGEKQITVDCDVIQADGGTRTAAITGGFVALALALEKLVSLSEIKKMPLIQYISAVSVGLDHQGPLLDLDYEEDSSVGTDMNVVMTHLGTFIEIQGTAEKKPFSQEQFQSMIEFAKAGCLQLFSLQAEHVGKILALK
jgi:ribonuclease PH